MGMMVEKIGTAAAAIEQYEAALERGSSAAVLTKALPRLSRLLRRSGRAAEAVARLKPAISAVEPSEADAWGSPTLELRRAERAVPACDDWKAAGECSTNSAFMLIACPDTCARGDRGCLRPGGGECQPDETRCKKPPPEDGDPRCPDWAEEGRCQLAGQEYLQDDGPVLGRPPEVRQRWMMMSCFVSCARFDPADLLSELKRVLPPAPAPFPQGLLRTSEAEVGGGVVSVTTPDGIQVGVERLSESPRVWLVSNIVTDDEADRIVELGKPRLERSDKYLCAPRLFPSAARALC